MIPYSRLLIIALFLSFSLSSLAATRLWTGNGANANADDPANWDTLPVAGDTVRFPTGVTNKFCNWNFADNLSLSQISFTDGGYSVSASNRTVILQNQLAINATNATGNNFFGVRVSLSASQVLQATTSGTELHLTRGITGAGRPSFSGNGKFWLGGVGDWADVQPLTISTNVGLLSTTAVPPGCSLQFFPNGNLELNGNDATFGGLAGPGSILFNTETLILDIGPSRSLNSTTVLNGTGTVAVQGQGTQNLTFSELFFGQIRPSGSATCITSGNAPNTEIICAGLSTSNHNGTLGNMVVFGPATFQPGNPTQCTSALFHPGSKFEPGILDSTTFSKLNCSGTCTINGATVNVAVGGGNFGDVYKFIQASQVDGEFLNAVNLSVVPIIDYRFEARYGSDFFSLTRLAATNCQTPAMTLEKPKDTILIDEHLLLTVSVTGDSGPATGQLTISIDGSVVATGSPPTLTHEFFSGVPDARQISADYAGDATYCQRSVTGSVTVSKNPIVVVSTYERTNDLQNPLTLQATVLRNSTGVSGKTVTFQLDGVIAGTAVTAGGNAEIQVPNPPFGVHQITASVAEDVLDLGGSHTSSFALGPTHDRDNDGYFNEEETAAGTDPDNYDSTPGPSNQPLGAKQDGLSVKTGKVKINAKKPNTDTIAVIGAFPAGPNGELPDAIIVNVGDHSISFTEEKKGTYTNGKEKIKVKVKDGIAAFTYQASKIVLGAELADEGLTTDKDAKKERKSVNIRIVRDGMLYELDQPIDWTSKKDVSGSGATPKK